LPTDILSKKNSSATVISLVFCVTNVPMKQNKLFLLGIGIFILSCHTITERLSGFEVHGIDVSHHQGWINWDSIAVQPIHFAFVKATEGAEHRDSLFSYNWAEMERIGIIRGAYHFFSPGVDPKLQAENFINQVAFMPGDLVPVVDVEVLGKNSADDLRDKLITWLDIIETHYGVRPLIYSNQKFYLENLLDFENEYPTWIARYNTIAPSISFTAPWDFWQYGNQGRVDGIKGAVDLNVFRGSLSEIEAFTFPKFSLMSDISF